MPRKVAGVEESIGSQESGAEPVEPDPYDKGKEESVCKTLKGVAIFTALMLLCFVMPLSAVVLLYSSLEAAPRTPAAVTSAAQEAGEAGKQQRHQLQQEPGLPAGPEEPAPTPQTGATSMVHCDTTAGPVTIAVHQAWSPRGAERFLDMVRSGFFSTQVALFRAVRGFFCQTGIAGDPSVHKLWTDIGPIEDDPQWLDLSDPKSMKRGYLSFAGMGRNSRRTEYLSELWLGTRAFRRWTTGTLAMVTCSCMVAGHQGRTGCTRKV
eukprot:TRINITY_DN54566_c0_g1_i1.p1 TRINITY_DN54566_c0_g1~~TRINITY_DN54566_c0_g1_i1.p1  ORF type:complete len:265 (+),score=35.40 TRINITY_DN54566_c0_g1_i1:65-859(+)